MDLRNLTEEEFLMLAEEEGKASINIGRRPHPSAFPSGKSVEVVVLAPEVVVLGPEVKDRLVKLPSNKRMESPRLASRVRADQKAS